MIDILSVVLGVIQEIVQIADEMEQAGTQAARLVRRLAELEAPVKRMRKSVEEGKDIFTEKNIRRLENLTTEGRDFLRRIKATNLFWRVLNRRSDLERFHALTEDIKEVVLIFNFEINVQAWEQENERDRENDWRRLLHIEKMLEEQHKGFEKAKEQIIVEQKKMHGEIMSHLQQSVSGADVRQRTTVRAIGVNCFLKKKCPFPWNYGPGGCMAEVTRKYPNEITSSFRSSNRYVYPHFLPKQRVFGSLLLTNLML